jgi:hypothetical protein
VVVVVVGFFIERVRVRAGHMQGQQHKTQASNTRAPHAACSLWATESGGQLAHLLVRTLPPREYAPATQRRHSYFLVDALALHFCTPPPLLHQPSYPGAHTSHAGAM